MCLIFFVNINVNFKLKTGFLSQFLTIKYLCTSILFNWDIIKYFDYYVLTSLCVRYLLNVYFVSSFDSSFFSSLGVSFSSKALIDNPSL